MCKLLLCRVCHDIFSLDLKRTKTCDCGQSSGQYKSDGWHAWIAGPCEAIGLANSTLTSGLYSLAIEPHSGEFGPMLKTWLFPRDYERIERREAPPFPSETT